MAVMARLSTTDDPRAEEALLAGLGDRSRRVRWVAIGALVDADGDRDIGPILAALRGDPNAVPPDAWEIIRFGLVHFTQARAAEVLGQALVASDDRQLRHEAAIHLEKLQDPITVPALVQALADDPYSPVRRESARALGAIGDRSADAALVAALDDPDTKVRRVARRALAKG
jgi:HEAT repeat protein